MKRMTDLLILLLAATLPMNVALSETTDASVRQTEKVQQLRALTFAYVKEFEANRRAIGWIGDIPRSAPWR